MKFCCLLGVAALLILALARPGGAAPAPSGQWNLPGPAPHLLCHYMPWFSGGSSATAPAHAWEHWKLGPDSGHPHDPERRGADGRRDIASLLYPLIGPYNSGSRAVIRYHLRTAQAAGIQGFLVDWNGPGTYSDKQIPLLLDEAQKVGMKVGLFYEEKSNFVWPSYRDPKNRAEALNNALGDLRYVLDRYTRHPAYLKRDGLPLIFQFNGYGEGKIGPKYYTPAEWNQVMARLPQKIVYGRQGLDAAYSGSAQCRYLWWSGAREDLGFNAQAQQMVRAGKASLFMAMVCPGFDDTGVWGWGGGPRVTPREGLSLLKDTFDHAFTGGPEIIQVVTWNDFNEGTVVEPTREEGFRDLDALATWWAAKTGRKTNLDAIRAPFREYARACSVTERAELPTPPYDASLARRPLTVAIPNYLTALAAKASQASH